MSGMQDEEDELAPSLSPSTSPPAGSPPTSPPAGSPPTSPPAGSPPTSPPAGSPPTSPACSPPTSPVVVTSPSTENSDSSPTLNSSRRQRRQKNTVCRTTISRKRKREAHRSASSDGSDSAHESNDNPSGSDQNHAEKDKDVFNFSIETETFELTGTRASDSDESSEESSRSASDSDIESDVSRSSCSNLSALSSVPSEHHDDCNSEESVHLLFNGSDMSANEALLSVLKLFVKERWTKTSLDETLKVIKRMLPQPNELPSSGRAALKQLDELTSSCQEEEFLFCDKCLQLVETVSDVCDHTGSHSQFYYFPIEEQVKHMFEQRNLASVIDSYRNHHSRKEDVVCDIVDGTEYLKVKGNLPNPYDLILLWNTDGVSLSSSSKQELWPVLCTIAEVPPRLRSSFIIVAGVFVHEKDPDMNVFLKPFLLSLKNLWKDGVSWSHPLTKENCTSKIIAPVLCADAPAKAKVVRTKNHNHRFGCLVCEQKTRKIRLPNDTPCTQTANKKKEKRVRRFLFVENDTPVPLRSGEHMDQLGELAEIRGKSRKGVTGSTVISEIPFLDRALCMCCEYMHLVLLGVVKYFLLKIVLKPGPWYIGDKLEEMDEFIMTIKVPDFICRLPRKLKDLKFWKASEFRSFLLFYSLPVFHDRLPQDYFNHWLLLVGAIHLLLADSISERDLASAEIMLRSFVRDVGTLYGDSCYVYNVHNLLHVCLLVRRWGPLWATSAFIFESFNGFLGAHVHGTKNLGKELISNIKISQSVAILENIVNAAADVSYQFNRLPVTEVLGKPRSNDILLPDELLALNVQCRDMECYTLFIRAKVTSKVYTTKLYDANKKRSDSYIQFTEWNGDEKNNKYGRIIAFLKFYDGSLYCFVNVLKIIQLKLFFHEESRYVIRNLLPFEETDIFAIVPIDCIKTKLLKIGMYLGVSPNSYEVKL